MAQYYAQRAGAGLIINEAIGISQQGLGWIFATGLRSDEQVMGWLRVTDAVHQAGGRIIAQLWHIRRTVHHRGERRKIEPAHVRRPERHFQAQSTGNLGVVAAVPTRMPDGRLIAVELCAAQSGRDQFSWHRVRNIRAVRITYVRGHAPQRSHASTRRCSEVTVES